MSSHKLQFQRLLRDEHGQILTPETLQVEEVPQEDGPHPARQSALATLR